MGRGGRTLAVCAVFFALAAPALASMRVVPTEPLFGTRDLSFVWPAQGVVTTPFYLHGHDGIDIGILRTPAVRAAAPGVVELVGQPVGYEGYGNVVTIRVTPTVVTIYAHLASSSVKPGDRVVAGQPIGIAGCTGYCSGTHLHFEVRESGMPVNPLQFLG